MRVPHRGAVPARGVRVRAPQTHGPVHGPGRQTHGAVTRVMGQRINCPSVEVIGSEVGREIHDAAQPAVPFNFAPARGMNRGTRCVFPAY